MHERSSVPWKENGSAQIVRIPAVVPIHMRILAGHLPGSPVRSLKEAPGTSAALWSSCKSAATRGCGPRVIVTPVMGPGTASCESVRAAATAIEGTGRATPGTLTRGGARLDVALLTCGKRSPGHRAHRAWGVAAAPAESTEYRA